MDQQTTALLIMGIICMCCCSAAAGGTLYISLSSKSTASTTAPTTAAAAAAATTDPAATSAATTLQPSNIAATLSGLDFPGNDLTGGGSATSAAACAAACQSNPQCVSAGYDAAAGSCDFKSALATGSANSAVAFLVNPGPSSLATGGKLTGGQYLVATDGTCMLLQQSDGNLVLYGSTGGALWASKTNSGTGYYTTLQSDGNLVVYGTDNKPKWASNTSGKPVTAAVVSNNKVQLQDASGNTLATLP